MEKKYRDMTKWLFYVCIFDLGIFFIGLATGSPFLNFVGTIATVVFFGMAVYLLILSFKLKKERKGNIQQEKNPKQK